MRDGIVNIIKYMSERFSKSFDDDDDFEEWADNVTLQYLETVDDKEMESKYMFKPTNEGFLMVSEMASLEEFAKDNGYDTYFYVTKVLVEKPKRGIK